MSTNASQWPPRDRDSLFVSPHEPVRASLPRPRLLGRVAVTVIIALAVQGGVFWQLHRSAAAKRHQVALEMQDFEQRAQELRAQMAALQGRLGQAQGEIELLHEHAVSPGPAPRPASASQRPQAATVKPRPQQSARPPSAPATRPAPIVLSPGCADTPLGC
jgi:uncharacterized protein HemX